MFLNTLIILVLINTSKSQALINNNLKRNPENYKTLQTGTIYLNSERPLWILQDQKQENFKMRNPKKEKVKYDHMKPIYYQNRQISKTSNKQPNFLTKYNNFKPKAQKHLSYAQSFPGLVLPRHYIPVRKNWNTEFPNTSFRSYHNSKFLKNMPVFDSAPGEESFTPSTPIFIYSGNRGRMLMNTMLSNRKYPMQEPVPGQVLYPPQQIIFKPQPLVESFQKQLNVTMIPFYAYEAIDPRSLNLQTTTATTSSPSSLFTPAKKSKTAKQYTAFYSPEEVLAQPQNNIAQYPYQLSYTTNSPPSLETPFNNHRFYNSDSSTTPLPHKKFEVTYNDGEDKFQITYEDDTPHIERPLNVETTHYTTTQAPVTYESYNIDKNYYAFPLYTMNKLMEKDENEQRSPEGDAKKDKNEVTVEQQRIEKYANTELKQEPDNLLADTNGDTWFILNSRYKGPLKTNLNNLHSSKYIQQSSPNVKLADDLNIINAKSATTIKSALQPKMRSLYGDEINMI